MRPVVFISYASEDEASARVLYNALGAAGLVEPWIAQFDIRPGQVWEEELKRQIKERSNYFVPLVSPTYHSKPGPVQSEMAWALEKQREMPHGKPFILPMDLGGDKAQHPALASLHWVTGDNWEEKVARLHSGMEVPQLGRLPNRPRPMRLGVFPGTGITTPCFFPSISGAAKAPYSATQHLELVTLHNPLESFLVSAYDVANAESPSEFKKLVDGNWSKNQVLLDSGVYERTWLHKEKTEQQQQRIWSAEDYYKWAKEVGFDACFPYDEFRSFGNGAKDAAEQFLVKLEIDRAKLGRQDLYPIVHPDNLTGNFVDFCVEVASAMFSWQAPMLAIPERDLGEDVFQVAAKIKDIRMSLDKRLDKYCSLHILGAGNPLAILAYSICGADSFDGIDWCQTVAEYGTGRLYHPLLFPSFDEGEYPSVIRKLPSRLQMLAHNLSFYTHWMKEIQTRTRKGSLDKMLAKHFPEKSALKLQKITAS